MIDTILASGKNDSFKISPGNPGLTGNVSMSYVKCRTSQTGPTSLTCPTGNQPRQTGRGMMAFEAIMGGALGDHALPGAQGRIDVLYWVHTAKHEPSVKQRM